MKFIFDYVKCCIISTASETEERPPPGGPQRRRRSPARGSEPDWRPSLFAISEDNAAVEIKKPENNVRPVTKQPTRARPTTASGSRCGVSSGRVNVPSSRSYEHRRDPLPMVIPAFSAAPFMF